MVPIRQSARTPVAGPPSNANNGCTKTPCRNTPVQKPKHRGRATRHFVAGPTPNETNETHCRYKTRVSCVSPLTKAKLTHICAGPNPGAIRYTQFITDMALEVNERCKRLALEHHKWHRIAPSQARNVASHPRPPAKRQGTRARAGACPGPGGAGDSQHFNHAICNNRKALRNSARCCLRCP